MNKSPRGDAQVSSRYTKEINTVKQGDRIHVSEGCYLQAQRRYENIGSFHMSYDYALRKAYDLAGEAMLTIGRLFTEVKSENQIFIRQSVMAKNFGISRATFIRHINRAKELGLLEPDPNEGGATHNIHLWRICPFLVWKGDRTSLNTYLASLPRDHVWLTTWQG